MQLRPRNKERGFYNQANARNLIIDDSNKRRRRRKPRGIIQIVENLSCLIAKKIVKANSLINIRIDLRNEEKNYLEECYNITKRFKLIPNFLIEYLPIKFETSRYNSFIIDKETFKMKFSNERKGKQIVNNTIKVFRHSQQLIIEFKKETNLIMNNFLEELLEDN